MFFFCHQRRNYHIDIQGCEMDYEVRYGVIADSMPHWCRGGEAINNELECKKLRSYSIKPASPGRISKVILRRGWCKIHWIISFMDFQTFGDLPWKAKCKLLYKHLWEKQQQCIRKEWLNSRGESREKPWVFQPEPKIIEYYQNVLCHKCITKPRIHKRKSDLIVQTSQLCPCEFNIKIFAMEIRSVPKVKTQRLKKVLILPWAVFLRPGSINIEPSLAI